MVFRGVILYRVQSFLSPGVNLNLDICCSCGTIDIEKSNSKGLLLMALNARQSPENRLQKIPMRIELNFEKISKTVKNSISKPRSFSQ